MNRGVGMPTLVVHTLPALQRLAPKPGSAYARSVRHMKIDVSGSDIMARARRELRGINYSVGQRLRRLREARK